MLKGGGPIPPLSITHYSLRPLGLDAVAPTQCRPFSDTLNPMLTAFIRFGDGRISTDASHASLAAALRDARAVFWVDIDKPEDEDYAMLDDVFGFHPLAIEDS